jgi:MOSC domain-containing protein YiiM
MAIQYRRGFSKSRWRALYAENPLDLDGDRQADLSVHGGPSKAAYAYPSEHYDYWTAEFPEMKLPSGMFGENFTTAGLFETELNVGDKFRVGSPW